NQESDIGQSAVESEQENQQLAEVPLAVTEQCVREKAHNHDHDHLAADTVKVHRHPLGNVRDVQVLPEGHVKRIKDKSPSVRIHKQSGYRRPCGGDELMQLLRTPANGRHSAPCSLYQTARDEQEKHDQAQRPGSVRICPKAKQERDRPQRGLASTAKSLQDDQQQNEIQIAE